MGGQAAGGEAHVTAGAVIMQTLPPVVIPADVLGLGLRVLFRASRSDPGLLGWPSREKRSTFGGGVGRGEAVLTPGSVVGLA